MCTTYCCLAARPLCPFRPVLVRLILFMDFLLIRENHRAFYTAVKKRLSVLEKEKLRKHTRAAQMKIVLNFTIYFYTRRNANISVQSIAVFNWESGISSLLSAANKCANLYTSILSNIIILLGIYKALLVSIFCESSQWSRCQRHHSFYCLNMSARCTIFTIKLKIWNENQSIMEVFFIWMRRVWWKIGGQAENPHSQAQFIELLFDCWLDSFFGAIL